MKIYFSLLLISAVISLALSFLMLSTSFSSKTDSEKLSPFECGFSGYEESRSPFSVHFFIVGLIFLIFDIELILLFPFATHNFLENNIYMMFMMIMFIVLLSVGLFLEWEKAMLEWRA